MSSSTIGSPHHFIAECVEKDMAVSFYYIYFIVGFADSEPASFTASFATSVDSEFIGEFTYIVNPVMYFLFEKLVVFYRKPLKLLRHIKVKIQKNN